MSQRFFSAIAFVLLVTASAAGQTGEWTPPRTVDGQPDLQGFWTNSTYTPLERPKDVTKEFYTRRGSRPHRKAGRGSRDRADRPGHDCGRAL